MGELGRPRAIETVGLLAEPARYSLYEWVSAQSRPVGRAAAAAAVGVPRTVAAFHLDKLAEAGLLTVTLGRTTTRRGPGSGRPARLYARSDQTIGLHLPPRSYDLLATVLAEAIEEAGQEEHLYRVAHHAGTALGRGQRDAKHGSRRPSRTATMAILRRLGYEPYAQGSKIRLKNCPFHDVQRSHPPLVCGANLQLIDGLLRGSGVDGYTASLDPRPSECCVVLASNAKKS